MNSITSCSHLELVFRNHLMSLYLKLRKYLNLYNNELFLSNFKLKTTPLESIDILRSSNEPNKTNIDLFFWVQVKRKYIKYI